MVNDVLGTRALTFENFGQQRNLFESGGVDHAVARRLLHRSLLKLFRSLLTLHRSLLTLQQPSCIDLF